MTPRRVLAIACALVLAATACGGDSDATSTPTIEATPTATTVLTPSPGPGTPGPTSEGSQTATAEPTPHVVVTASPDEPVATTAYIPASELPHAVMTRASDGATFVLPIEVPDRSEYGVGLSGRLELGERGMLFWYPDLTSQPFWMQNTHFDLSIAFVDGDGTIVDILLMTALSLEPRSPDQQYRYAIEAPAGWFDERGLAPGDSAILDFDIPDSLRR